ncbi:putative Levodione reductase [Paraburkholderia caribensis]|nr:putative Levodione reductase [Paraburkholderia caribensis]
MFPSLRDRVAVITGAASGIGRSTAIRLAREGCKLAIADIDAAGLDATVSYVRDLGAEVLAMPVDLARTAQVKSLGDKIAHHFGYVDILHNNAGANLKLPIGEITEEAWDRCHAINIKAPFFLTQSLLPHLGRGGRGGVIINTASMGGLRGMPGNSAYGSAKAALVGMTKVWAVELAPRDVRVHCLAPGTIDTAMPQDVLKQLSENDRAMWAERFTSRQLFKRFGEPSDVASVVAFLASDEATFLTGLVIPIDGGFSAW